MEWLAGDRVLVRTRLDDGGTLCALGPINAVDELARFSATGRGICAAEPHIGRFVLLHDDSTPGFPKTWLVSSKESESRELRYEIGTLQSGDPVWGAPNVLNFVTPSETVLLNLSPVVDHWFTDPERFSGLLASNFIRVSRTEEASP